MRFEFCRKCGYYARRSGSCDYFLRTGKRKELEPDATECKFFVRKEDLPYDYKDWNKIQNFRREKYKK